MQFKLQLKQQNTVGPKTPMELAPNEERHAVSQIENKVDPSIKSDFRSGNSVGSIINDSKLKSKMP